MSRLAKTFVAAGPLLKTVVGYGALELGARAVQATAIFVLAYVFRKEEFGTFYGYLAAYQLATVLGTGGLLESLMGRIGTSKRERTREIAAAHTRHYLRRSVWIMGFAMAGGGIAPLVHVGINLPTLFTAVAGGLAYGLVILVATYLTYSGSNRQSMYLRSGNMLASYLLAAAIAMYTRQILSFFTGMCIAGILTLLALLVIRDKSAITASAHHSYAEKLGNGYAWFVVPALFNWFFWYGLVIFVSSFFGAARAAELAFANNIASILLMINTAVSQAWVSKYLRGFAASPARTESQTARVFKVQSAAMTVAAVALVIFYELLFTWRFPLVVKYSHLGYQISVLLFSISISSAYFSAINSFAVNGRGRQLAAISVVAYVFSIIVLVALSFKIGTIGVYFGLALLIVSRGFTITWYAKKYLNAGFLNAGLIIINIFLFSICAWYYFYYGAYLAIRAPL